MSQEIGKIFTRFPLSRVTATGMKKNMVISEDHRDLLLRIDYPPMTKFRLHSLEATFFDPEAEEELHEYIFSSGQESYLWLSKFHDGDLLIERMGEAGWESFGSLSPSRFDQADYSHEHARPAPMIFKVGPADVALGSKLPKDKPKALIPEEYRAALARREEDGGPNAEELLRKWTIDKTLPRMAYAEGMRSCHAYPGEPETDLMIEILPATKLYVLAPEDDSGTIQSSEDAWTAADAIGSIFGEVIDKQALARDLRGVNFYITVQQLSTGQVKKFIVFKGYSGVRNLVTASQYSVENVKIITVSANNLTMGQLSRAGMGKMAGMGGIASVIAVTLETAQWISEGGKDVERLFAKASIAVIACMLASGLEPFVAAAISSGLKAIAAAFTMPGIATGGMIVLAVGGSLVVIGVLIGIALSYTPLPDWLTELFKRLKDAWGTDLEQVGYDIGTFHGC